MELTKKMVRQGFIAIIAIVCAFTVAFGLSACGGKSEEEAVKDVLTTELDGFKNISDDAMKAFETAGGEGLEQLGIDTKALINSWLDGFDYTIGDITVDGDTAKATVTITSKNLMNSISDFPNQIQTYAQNNSGISEADLYAKAGEMIQEDVDAAELETTDVVITLKKDSKGNWSIDDAGMQAISDAVVGDTTMFEE